MHSRLGESEARVDLPGRDGILDDDSGGLTATADRNRVVLLLWHFDLLRLESRSWKIELKNLPEPLRSAKRLELTEYRIDHEHNNPYTKYVLQNADSQGGAYNLKTVQLDAVRNEGISVIDGDAMLEVALPNQSVTLLQIEP
jgi:beta-xylosidase